MKNISTEDLLVLIYNEDTHSAAVVGKICDEVLDRSGALLARVREKARHLTLACTTVGVQHRIKIIGIRNTIDLSRRYNGWQVKLLLGRFS